MMEREQDDDDLQRQLEAQLLAQDRGGLTAQPVGAPERLTLPPGNSGVTGGTDFGGPTAGPGPVSRADAASRATAAGFKDIEGAGGLRQGSYGVEGFGDLNSTERGANTMKKTMGKIMTRYDSTQPGALRKLVADEDLRAYWPNASIVEHENEDQIDPDGPDGPLQPVDVIRGATAGGAGQGWQWSPLDDAGAGGDMGGGDDISALIASLTGGGGGGDPLAAIQGQIGDLSSGQGSDIQALIEQLLQGQPQV